MGYLLTLVMCWEERSDTKSEAAMQRLKRLDTVSATPLEELFAMLDYYCRQGIRLTPLQSQVITGIGLPAEIKGRSAAIPDELYRPIFSHLHQAESTGRSGDKIHNPTHTTASAFVSAGSAAEGRTIVVAALAEKLSKILDLTLETVQSSRSIASYGIDSLVGLELKNWIAKEMGADLAVFEILSRSSLDDLGSMIVEKSRLKGREYGDIIAETMASFFEDDGGKCGGQVQTEAIG